jgi:uncharacterized membrane protein YwaF
LVVGMRIAPRPGAVARVFLISVVYTAIVGTVDGLTGANYMFLRRPPGEWTLLRVMGPWPWYTFTAAVVALVLFTLLDLPFWAGRRALSAARESSEIGPQDDRRPVRTAPSTTSEGRLRSTH